MPLIKHNLGHQESKSGVREISLQAWQRAGLATGDFKDAGESPFFIRALEHIKTEVIETEYAITKARLLLPVNTEADPGVDNITWRQFDQVGSAILARDYSQNIPRVDIVGTEFFNNPVHSIVASFGYNVQEMRAAQYTGLPLDTRRAKTCKEAIRRKENDLAFTGDVSSKLTGFLNNTSMSQVVIPSDGNGAASQWATKTADQILRDLYLIVSSIVTLTLDVEHPDTMILPLAAWNLAKMKRIGIDSTMTVLEFFLKTNGYIKDVDTVVQLAGIGAGSTDRVIVYDRDPEKLEMWVTMEAQQYEPVYKNREYTVEMESRYAGVLIYKPLSLAYADGI